MLKAGRTEILLLCWSTLILSCDILILLIFWDSGSYCAHPPGIPCQPSLFLYSHRESFQTGFDTKLLRLGDSLEELLDSGFCWWLPWTLGQNVVDSCLDIVGDLFFAVAAALVLQLSICLFTSFIEFCSQKMMAMGLMLTSCTGIEGFLNELWFSWNSILPVG